MNSLISATLNSSASRSADEARASTARAQSAKAELGGQFSRMLRGYDKPAAEAAPLPAATPPKHDTKAEGKTETQRQEARSAAPKKSAEPPSKSTAEQATAATVPPAGEAGEAAAARALSSTSTEEVAPKDEVASADSAITALLAPATPLPLALPMVALGTPGRAKAPVSEIAADDGAQADGGKGSAKTGTVGTSTTASTSRPLDRSGPAAAEDLKAKAGDASTQDSAADFASALADAVQAQPAALRSTESGPRARSDAAAALEGIAGASTQASASALNPAGAEMASPARVSVASPLYTPGFAPEMAARLSVLAADGVQTAQLHLNPADMGPVAVQIVVEGQQARIEFQADQADTRAVLERSLPDLAAALRDSGLTLTGGGVFQQFAGQGPSGARARSEGNAPRRSGRDMSDALSALPVRTAPVARQTQGVVDLYA
ncbi:MAG: flagellar hook-length control protein FliK [Microbacteriaceae bacterium]|nr:flagellar hook-length control protein FliK [Burkholderiaceae bacterium]